jgi:hypothetical protein
VCVLASDDDDHADPAVEDAVHFAVGDAAFAAAASRTVSGAATPPRDLGLDLSGRMRGTLPVRPPPVMCAMPLTGSACISASSGLT